MKRWKCVSKIQLFQICCSILRPLSLANAVSQCPVSFLYLAGLDIMTNGWYWHIELPPHSFPLLKMPSDPQSHDDMPHTTWGFFSPSVWSEREYLSFYNLFQSIHQPKPLQKAPENQKNVSQEAFWWYWKDWVIITWPICGDTEAQCDCHYG